jgi:hypothetical protein
MKRNPKHVVVWGESDRLYIDLPKSTTLHMVNGILRAAVPVTGGDAPINSLVNIIGVPITKIVSVPYKEKT